MRNIVESFCTNFDLWQGRIREEHYQLAGTKNTHLTENVQKILEVFDTHVITWKHAVKYSIFSRKRFCLQILLIREQKYWDFVTERLLGKKSIWDTMKKTKLPTFISNNVQLKVLVINQYLTLKEERKLIFKVCHSSKMLSRHLPGYFGMDKFSVVSKSLFYTW